MRIRTTADIANQLVDTEDKLDLAADLLAMFSNGQDACDQAKSLYNSLSSLAASLRQIARERYKRETGKIALFRHDKPFSAWITCKNAEHRANLTARGGA